MTKLEEKIICRIKASGPISFRDFMEAALYDPEFGYYCTPREKIGRSGDYYTSANVDEAFGALLAKQCVEMRSEFEDRSCLTIVEIGAGTGQLAADIINALKTEQGIRENEIEYLICEASPAMRARQTEKLRENSLQVQWTTLEELASSPVEAVVLSNEVVDALPVHRVQWRDGKLLELYVEFDGKRLKEQWRVPSTDRLAEYLKRQEIELLEEQIAEINLDAIDWLRQISSALRRGFVITIDYGDLADHLYAPDRFEGTLRCFYRHTLNANPFDRIGEQDMTADANFSALIEYGKDFGLETIKSVRQADYLIRLGLLDRLQRMVESGKDDFQSMKARLALKNFFVPGGISDHFKALVQRKS